MGATRMRKAAARLARIEVHSGALHLIMKTRQMPKNNPPHPTEPSLFRSVMPPVHRAATVFFNDVDDLERSDWRCREAYTYGREGSPTTRELEDNLAALEGARHAMLAPSGLAAFSITCLGLLKAGDRVALPANGYGTGGQMVDVLMRRFGVEVSVYEPTAPATWQETIPPGTRLVWTEAPGSVTMEVPDLPLLIGHARAVGAKTAMDNTYSAGLHFKPFGLGIDVSMQALTKFQSGGADVVMGSLACVDDTLQERLREARHFLGLGVSPDDAYLVLRGLPTLRMRYEHSSRSGEVIAGWFRARPGVQRVLYPPFDETPGFAHWKAHFSAAAGLFSVALSEQVREPQVKAFINGLRQFRIGFSWGGPTSLVMPYGRSHPAVRRLRELGEPVGSIVRFWVGLEEPQLLLDDVASAWDQAMCRRAADSATAYTHNGAQIDASDSARSTRRFQPL